jgi:hypothetical protein
LLVPTQADDVLPVSDDQEGICTMNDESVVLDGGIDQEIFSAFALATIH